MRKPTFLTSKTLMAAGAVFAAAASAYANGTIFLEVGPQYGGTNPYQYADGGEFTALTTGLPSKVPAGYSSLATFAVKGVTGFETFCIEDQVDFYVGHTYNYSLGMSIQQSTASVKQLSAGVAWLYEDFATGAAAGAFGYNYTNAATRKTDAGQLQALIWALQGEPNDPNNPFNSATNIFYSSIISHFGTFAKAQVAASSSYGVQVLELTDSNGGIAQDQLIYTGGSVPDNGTTAVLIGVSLLGLVLISRRVKVGTSS